MPLYFSSLTTACLTRQARLKLVQDLMADREVAVRRTPAGRLPAAC